MLLNEVIHVMFKFLEIQRGIFGMLIASSGVQNELEGAPVLFLECEPLLIRHFASLLPQSGFGCTRKTVVLLVVDCADLALCIYVVAHDFTNKTPESQLLEEVGPLEFVVDEPAALHLHALSRLQSK